MTSPVQPLDQGVIRNFKVHYRKFLMQKLISVAEACTSVHDFKRQVNVLDAWRSVTEETIVKCFRISGFSTSSDENIVDLNLLVMITSYRDYG